MCYYFKAVPIVLGNNRFVIIAQVGVEVSRKVRTFNNSVKYMWFKYGSHVINGRLKDFALQEIDQLFVNVF